MTKKVTDKSKEIIQDMFLHLSQKDYQIMLDVIDNYIVTALKIKEEDLPWVNKEKYQKDDFDEFYKMLRLVAARFFSEHSKLNHKHTKH
jgi:hypothetical protein